MINISVRKETHGWAVHIGECVTSPFWSIERAIREANALADSIRRHGACVDVVVEDDVRVNSLNLDRPVSLGEHPTSHGQMRVRQQRTGHMKPLRPNDQRRMPHADQVWGESAQDLAVGDWSWMTRPFA